MRSRLLPIDQIVIFPFGLLQEVCVWVLRSLAKDNLSKERRVIDDLGVAWATGGGAEVDLAYPLPSGHATFKLETIEIPVGLK